MNKHSSEKLVPHSHISLETLKGSAEQFGFDRTEVYMLLKLHALFPPLLLVVFAVEIFEQVILEEAHSREELHPSDARLGRWVTTANSQAVGREQGNHPALAHSACSSADFSVTTGLHVHLTPL